MSFILCYEYRSSCDMIKSQRIFSIQPNFQKSTHSSLHNHISSYTKWWREIPYRESNSVNKSHFFVIIISRPVNVVALVTKLFLCVTSDERTQNYVNVPKYARLFGFWRPLKFPHSMLVQVDQWDLTRMAGIQLPLKLWMGMTSAPLCLCVFISGMDIKYISQVIITHKRGEEEYSRHALLMSPLKT